MRQLLYYFILDRQEPSEIFHLSHYAFKLYFCFIQFAKDPQNTESPNGLPVKPHELFGIGARTFRQAVKELEAEGLIRTERTIYVTTNPCFIPEEEQTSIDFFNASQEPRKSGRNRGGTK